MPDQTKPVILNVDDAEAQRYAVARTLEGAGFTVWQAGTGQEGLEKAAKLPDLIILDIKLPDINGFEVCRRLKANPETASIPVLHQSAMFVDSQFRVTGLEGGADAYLIHPIEPEELLATVRALLRLRRAERDRRESETRYRTMFDLTPMPCWVFDLETQRFVEVNESAIRTYGYSREDFLTLNLGDISEDLPELVQAMRDDLFAGNTSGRHRCRDGNWIEVEGSCQSIQLGGKRLGLAIFNDVTERNRMVEREAAAQIRREVLGRLMATQEAERQRIARELHDEAGQLLASLLVGLRSVSESKRLEDARKQAKQLRSLASRAMDEIGNLARGLHPTVLDDLGLAAALSRLLADYEKIHGVRVTLKTGRCRPDQLPPAVQIGLYRIIQEALTNVARHAEAKSVKVTFKPIPKAVEVTVEDDGKGFDSSVQGRNIGSRLGLQSMRERAAFLGGRVEIASGRGGTRIVARIPTEPVQAASRRA
ncbi:MAG TPA: response regulator [Candidatus Angelobacter sp.]|nr:response regulator [Candidatus Angelobacter sp.]